ncbi:MAG: hypothetical protein K2M12_06735 [Muribaculaceae bacterium]|nr:hypothetical protein [Muribaculaceae bacterium]
MIKRLLTLAAAVAAISFGAAADTMPLSLAELSSGWGDSTYDPDTKTITYVSGWTGKGWWLGDVDYSAYDEVVVETIDNTIGFRIVVEYVNSSDASQVDVPVDRLKGVCELNPDYKDHVKQIYIQGFAEGTLTLKDAYLQNAVEVDPSAPVVLWEGEKAIDWWGNAVDLVPTDFIAAHTVAGDVLKLEYTAGEGNAFKIVCVDKSWSNSILPAIAALEGYNTEHEVVPLPTDGVFELELDEENAAILTDAAGYNTFKFCGDGVTLKKITILHDAGEQPSNDWKSLVIGGDAANGSSESFISTPTYGPAATAEVAGKTAYYTEIQANCANPWDAQFFIHTTEPMLVGEKIRVSFDFYCTDSRDIETQCQAGVGAYLWYNCLGNLSASNEWKSFNKEIEVTTEMSPADKDPFQTIAFNLGTDAAAATFYIANIKVEKYAPVQDGITNVVVDENAPVEYFNLQGVRVANPESGLYIRRQGNKTTKVIIK